MICWQPYTSLYTASAFSKNSYIKTLIILYPCSISYNLSQGVLRRSKYSSGVFSINFLHSDSLASVLIANLTCSLSMGLIEQGIVLITSLILLFLFSLFIYSKLPAFSFNNKIFSFSRGLWCSFLICASGIIEIVNPISQALINELC